MSVPLIDLGAQYRGIRDEIRSAVERVLDSQRYILGPEGEALEAELADYCGCSEAVGVSSGTDALLVALMAMGIGPGDEVITPAFTFFATAGSIARVGATPVFVDIERASFNLDPSKLEAGITDRTRAIMVVHLFGQMADMEAVLEVAGRHGLAVIEDAAQAVGAEFKNQRAGSIGVFGCFSFYPSKNLGGCGDGGMLTTSDPELARKARMLRNHGFADRYHNELLGGNFRLDELQAAVLRVKLRYLDVWTEARRSLAVRYRGKFVSERITDSSGSHGEHPEQDHLKGIRLPVELPDRRHVYNQFVVRAAKRDGLLSHLQSRNVGCVVYYPMPLHLLRCFGGLGYGVGDFPESERASIEALALPMYPELSAEMQAEVVRAAGDFYSDSIADGG